MRIQHPRRLLCLLLALFMLSGSALAAAAAPAPGGDELAPRLAADLEELGLLRGIAEDDFALEKVPSRLEALVMLVRLLGKESEALSGNHEHPFTDVPEWANGYVGYAYDAGLTQGVSETAFDPDVPATSSMYLTFLLRTLGYEDIRDFYWITPHPLAADCGLLPREVDLDEFLRRDMVLMSCAALTALLKDGTATLAEKLVADGAFTAERYAAVFDEGAFALSRGQDAAVNAAILEYEGTEPGKNAFAGASHIILETSENTDGTINLSAAGCWHLFEVDANGSYGGSVLIFPLYMVVKPAADGSCETLSYWSPQRPESDPDATEATKFSAAFLEKWNSSTPELRTWTDSPVAHKRSLMEVTTLRAGLYIKSGGFVYQYPTHDEKLEELLDTGRRLDARLDAPGYGSILLMTMGTPHGSSTGLYLLGGPDGPLQEGKTYFLPLPAASRFSAAAPDSMTLSEDGSKLYYSVTFDEALILPADDGSGNTYVLHEQGVYQYTADLATGKTELEIIQQGI